MKKGFTWIAIVGIIIAMLFGACGKSVPVPIQTALRGIRWAIEGKNGSFMYMKDGVVLMFSPLNGGYQMTGFTLEGDPIKELCTKFPGLKEGLASTVDKVGYLTRNGWVRAFKSDLPQPMVTMLTSFSMYLVSIGVGTLSDFLMIPLVNFEFLQFPKGVMQ